MNDIVVFGHPSLTSKSENIINIDDYVVNLSKKMIDIMYAAPGVGLAAPQIGKDIRLFVIDASPFAEDEELSDKDRAALKDFNKVFINAKIIEEEGEEWVFNEGCLSIPDVREDVIRKPNITIEYLDENFEKHTESLDGLAARVFQHEYDHIEGILFTDKLSSLKKRIIKKKLENISKGKIRADYRMRFPNQKKGK